MLRLSEIRKSLAFRFTEPVARLLARTAITPSTITWLGFLLAAGAAAFIITGHLFAAGVPGPREQGLYQPGGDVLRDLHQGSARE